MESTRLASLLPQSTGPSAELWEGDCTQVCFIGGGHWSNTAPLGQYLTVEGFETGHGVQYLQPTGSFERVSRRMTMI